MSELKKVNIYIDGACSGNPGPGGYGIVMEYNGKKMEKSGGFNNTTNNRMEIMAAIVALESLWLTVIRAILQRPPPFHPVYLGRGGFPFKTLTLHFLNF